ncbi:predicted protein [Histoplasma capsulatum G186AR]|uniref:Uncharacterized protein n=1 Tax=Ajellomyces capsulatus (strain G186AR / H82 / ATCC MYA-2454 / RMSCC 2432) TaxID=447093 RepID=C0NZ46_AJECG|nr:uncharacterized protein HCBG_08426 [Histoplasma capsulatum G186AR]EEH03486.1 predicted protein [Histoplasma capsulatum G186AR]
MFASCLCSSVAPAQLLRCNSADRERQNKLCDFVSWSLKDPQPFFTFAITPPFTASNFTHLLRRLGGVLLPIMRFTHMPRRAYRISGKDEILGGRTNKLLPIRHRACEGLLGRDEMKSTRIDRKARLAHAAICTFSDLHVHTTGHDFNECRICQRGRCYPRNWRSTAGDGRNAFRSAHAVLGPNQTIDNRVLTSISFNILWNKNVKIYNERLI